MVDLLVNERLSFAQATLEVKLTIGVGLTKTVFEIVSVHPLSDVVIKLAK